MERSFLMNGTEKRPFSLYILMALILIQGISGLFGGGTLVLDPTGDMLKMPLSLLESSPFDNYLVPGIILLLVLGTLPLIVLYGLFRSKTWAWSGAFLVGVALIIWIGVEIIMIGYQADPPLQLVYGMVGLALLVLTQLPSVRNALKSEGITIKNVVRR